MTAPDAELVSSIRGALADAADPAKAAPMQAYMKSEMPYRGIPSPDLKAVLRPLLADHPLDEETWQATVLALWDEAGFREERYAALALARHRLHREHRQSTRWASTSTWSAPAPGGTSSTRPPPTWCASWCSPTRPR